MSTRNKYDISPIVGEQPSIEKEPSWWDKLWGGLTKKLPTVTDLRVYYDKAGNELHREAVNIPIENRYKGDYFKTRIIRAKTLGSMLKEILPQPSPEWQEKYYLPTVMSVIETKIKRNEELSQEELDTVDTFMKGHVNRAPGYSAEEWLKQPEGVRKFYNYATTAAIIAGVTYPIWGHPSFARGVKYELKSIFGKTPPKKITVPAGFKTIGKVSGKPPRAVKPITAVTKEPSGIVGGFPSMKMEAQAGLWEIRGGAYKVERAVKNLAVRAAIDKQIFSMLEKIKAESRVSFDVPTEAIKIIEYTSRHYPSDLTMMLKPDFIESTLNLINNDLERILPGLFYTGLTVMPEKEVISEEDKIVAEAGELEEVSPYGEKFVTPEEEARIPKETVDILPRFAPLVSIAQEMGLTAIPGVDTPEYKSYSKKLSDSEQELELQRIEFSEATQEVFSEIAPKEGITLYRSRTTGLGADVPSAIHFTTNINEARVYAERTKTPSDILEFTLLPKAKLWDETKMGAFSAKYGVGKEAVEKAFADGYAGIIKPNYEEYVIFSKAKTTLPIWGQSRVLEIAPKAEVPGIPPTKPPIPPRLPPSDVPKTPGEPEIDPIAKLTELIKQAKPLRKEIEKAYTKERVKRIGEVEKFIEMTIDGVGGEEGYKIILSKLKGELVSPEAKPRFEPVKEKLTEDDLKSLYLKIWKHPYLDNWEKVSAADGFTNLFMGAIPQPKKLALLEEVYGSELIKSILSKRVWGAKATDFVVELLNVPRALLATADMSAFLRQGVIEIPAHPIISAKAIAKTFEFAFSPKSFEQYFVDLKEDELYPLMRKSGLSITNPSRAGMVEREEAFISRFLQKIPILKVPVTFAERAYVGFLNKLRVDIFKLWANELLAQGLSPVKDKDTFKATADVVNTFTGRGSLPFDADKIAPQLNTLFFSPRLIAARFNALNPVWYAKQPPEIRKRALGDFAKFVAAGITTLALIKMATEDEVEIDPRSSDFGKVKIGNTRFDIWGGFQQWARVFAQITMGERKVTTTGEIVSLNKNEYPFTTRKEVLLRFIEGKLAPVPALLNELASGAKTFTGEDMTLQSVAFQKFIPMYIQDIAEAYADGGLERATLTGTLAFFGVGAQTWGGKKWQWKPGDKMPWEKTPTGCPYVLP